jgi:polysaccharide export outer membrane protein
MLRNVFVYAAFAFATLFGPLATAQTSTEGSPTASAPASPANLENYRLGASDKIRINVFGEEQLSGEFVVSDSGQVNLPLIGEIPAKGATITDLQNRIVAKLSDGYLKEPRVSVEVMNYRPFYIMGEVRKPGEYPYTSGLTVLNAVATAQGFTYRANTKKVFIRHAGDAKEDEQPLGSTTQVGPGDTIRISERFF